MACIDWRRGPVEPVRVGNEPGRGELVRCPYFQLDYVRGTESFRCGGDGRLQAVIVLHGDGRLEGAGSAGDVATGQVWLLPAALPPVWCRPRTELTALLCSLP